jgi:hypothetical protein
MRGVPARAIGRQFGFDVYEIGPEEARIRIYRRAAGDLYFTCDTSGIAGRGPVTLCDNMFRLHDMNHAQFYFNPRLTEHMPEIEAGIRQLMASFVREGGQNDVNGVEFFDAGRN